MKLCLWGFLTVVAAELLAFGHFTVASRMRAFLLLLSLYLGHGTLLQTDYPADSFDAFTLLREAVSVPSSIAAAIVHSTALPLRDRL